MTSNRVDKDQTQGMVLDASVAAASALEEDRAAMADRVIGSLVDGFALVPALWHFETANIMSRAVRRGRITAAAATAFFTAMGAYDIRTDVLTPHAHRLSLESQQFGLTAYDTSYLLLARDRGLPLATLDDQLAAAATRAGVTLVA